MDIVEKNLENIRKWVELLENGWKNSKKLVENQKVHGKNSKIGRKEQKIGEDIRTWRVYGLVYI